MVGLGVAVGIKNLSVGICDGAPSTALSSTVFSIPPLTKKNHQRISSINCFDADYS